MRFRVTTLAIVILAACGDDDSPDSPDGSRDAVVPSATVLSMTWHRELATEAPYPIVVTLVAERDGDPARDLEIEIDATGATVSSVMEGESGTYKATVTPSSDGAREIAITARTADGTASVQGTALSMSFVDETWDQPEAVPGLVNTLGTEDAATVSPDGEWLLVGTYTPVDILCCLIGGPPCSTATTASDPESPPCNVSLGPYDGPERPDLPGADRILSASEIRDSAPTLGLEDIDSAIPPAAAYGFRRQEDGSFAEPFVIALDIDGYTYAPTAFSFVGAPEGDRAGLVFAMSRLDAATKSDVYFAEVTLGRAVSLGTYRDGVLADFPGTALVATEANEANPSFGLGQVWFDHETETEDLHFASVEGTLPSGAVGEITAFPLNQPDVPMLWPFADDDGSRVYWGVSAAQIASAPLIGSDVSAEANWGAPRLDLATTGAESPGEIVSMGEPSIARDDDEEWLYFVYYTVAETGYDGQVGRVRRR